MYVYMDEATKSFVETGVGVESMFESLRDYANSRSWTPEEIETVVFQVTHILADVEPNIYLKDLLTTKESE